jgi:hypothetical protein
MKTFLLSAFLLAAGMVVAAEPVVIQEPAAEKVRKFWVKSKGYLSEELPTFKEGAEQTLLYLDREIKQVTAKAGNTPPAYFLARLQALRLQHEHLSAALKEIDAAAVKNHLSGPRYAFDKCMDSLEAALTQASDEAEVLAKINHVPKTTGI